jgi:periplasmic protein TonB
MARAQTNRSPALIASALGHVAIVVAALISWPWLMHPMQLGKVVPVTLVTNGPPAELAPAVKAPEPAPTQAPEPMPQAPPQPAPIAPAPPQQAPEASTPKPAPAAKPSPAKPTPALKPAPAAAAKSASKSDLDLDSLLASIKPSSQRASTQQTSGQIGANRQRTAPVAQDGQGEDTHMSSNEIQALGDKLGKLWNPNCQVLGANNTDIKVRMQLTPQGFVVRKQLVNEAEVRASNNPVLIAAADRALSAIGRGEPYTDVLNPAHYADWRDIVVKFNAKDVCSK